MGGIYYLAQYEYDPNSKEIGGYETRTARYADTTFTYRSKIVTPAESALRDFQTLLVEIEQSYQDSIQVVFDDLLQKENIYAQSIIGITSSFYTKKNEWSGDTLALKPNYRTAFTNQGVYEDINYYAYIHYSSYTIWHLMHKTLIYILFICCLVIGIFLFWWTRKLKKEIANTTEVKKDGNYYIKDLTYYVNEKRLVLKEKEVKLSPQLHELLLMFLKTDRYRVAKIEIRQKFWPKSIDATSNMTSTINRLNKELKEIDCAYTIISDPKNDEYYIFSELPPASPELQ
ncbi:hypothetical protein D0T87_06630 [Bacteroides sp. 51]|nr:hypothetical protein [Bacteroides sp. 51]